MQVIHLSFFHLISIFLGNLGRIFASKSHRFLGYRKRVFITSLERWASTPFSVDLMHIKALDRCLVAQTMIWPFGSLTVRYGTYLSFLLMGKPAINGPFHSELTKNQRGNCMTRHVRDMFPWIWAPTILISVPNRTTIWAFVSGFGARFFPGSLACILIKHSTLTKNMRTHYVLEHVE